MNYFFRQQKLKDSEDYQQLMTNIHEEESWISEKMVLVSNDDHGDTLASVQGLLKKHEAFDTDFEVHKKRAVDIKAVGDDLLSKVCLKDCYDNV